MLSFRPKKKPSAATSFAPAAPRPRSLQSRFILMEGATVMLAIALMICGLALSIRTEFRFTAGVQSVQNQIALHSEIHDAFDATVLSFWRYDGTNDPQLLQDYRNSEAKLRSLTRKAIAEAHVKTSRNNLENLKGLEESYLSITDELVIHADAEQAAQKLFSEISLRELTMREALGQIQKQQFATLNRDTQSVMLYGQMLRILLLGLGFFSVAAMLWFSRAHRQHIWKPLETLHAMVLEMRRGNLDVHAEIPATVELGSLTRAFLAMASELREMRDSLEEKVRQRAKQLEVAQKDLLRAAKLASLGQLVSGVAHEINNPLTAILGFSEVVLAQPKLDPALRGQIQTIREESLRLKRLVRNLSQFGRRTPPQLHRIDLRAVPDRLLELRRYQLAANGISVSYDRPGRPVWIKGDRDALLQMMMQLVLNAEEAIRERATRGKIIIRCESAGDHALLGVQDDGCGMSAEMCEHVFDPFFTTRTRSGAGLGLSICHGIVQQHAGDLSVESEPGRGTTFTVRLPLASLKEPEAATPAEPEPAVACAENNGAAAAPEPLVAAAPVAAPQNSTNGGPAKGGAGNGNAAESSQRFLVIDDEPGILDLVTEVLSTTGAEVVKVQDSTKLAAALGDPRFDAVLCDLKMPG